MNNSPLPPDAVPPPLPSRENNDPQPASSPPPLPDADANADPLTGEPGAHPIGVGIGAVGTGIIGAALGAIAGPAGIVAGTAVGALAGGLLGKGAAESVNPTHATDPLEYSNPLAKRTPAGTIEPPTSAASQARNVALPESVTIIARNSYPEDNVRVAAYHRYLHRRDHGIPGDEIADWVEAEKEVLRTD